MDMATHLNSTEERVLALLGQGISPEIAASAVGISPSRISQLVSDPIFAAKVAELRFSALLKHTKTDEVYDDMEYQLQERLKNLIPFMHKPMEILKAIQIINGAKRRGLSAPEQIHQQRTVVTLNMPVKLVQQYTTNIQVNSTNQVVKAGDQELITASSTQVETLAKKALLNHVKDANPPTITASKV